MSENNAFMGKVLPKIKGFTEKTIDIMSVLLLSFIFVLGIAQVVWRWILRDPIVWSEELIQLTYVWICYLGWAIAERKDSHIRITAVHNMFPQSAQKWIQIFCHILCIVFSVLMVYFGIQLVGAGAKRTAVSIALNYAIVYVMGPITNLVIICYEIAGLIECFVKGPRDYRDKGGDEE